PQFRQTGLHRQVRHADGGGWAEHCHAQSRTRQARRRCDLYGCYRRAGQRGNPAKDPCTPASGAREPVGILTIARPLRPAAAPACSAARLRRRHASAPISSYLPLGVLLEANALSARRQCACVVSGRERMLLRVTFVVFLMTASAAAAAELAATSRVGAVMVFPTGAEVTR